MKKQKRLHRKSGTITTHRPITKWITLQICSFLLVIGNTPTINLFKTRCNKRNLCNCKEKCNTF